MLGFDDTQPSTMTTATTTARSIDADNGLAGRPLYAPPASLRSLQGGASSSSSSSSSSPRPFDENDPRVFFDRQSGTWRCEAQADEQKNGVVELEWDVRQRAWLPVLDDDLIRAQQAAYNVEGVDEETPAAPVLRRQKKRNRSPANEDGTAKGAKQPRRRVNTSVYVTGLPLDCSKEEIAKVFSRYGVLNEDDAGEPRIKMYADQKTGMFKGEALVTYFKEESVELAIRVLDESSLRAAEGKMDPVMHVMQAEFGGGRLESKEVDMEKHNAQTRDQCAGEQAQPARKQLSEAEKRHAHRRYAKMNKLKEISLFSKLLDWNSDSDDAEAGPGSAAGASASAKADLSNVRQVCLRRMFTLAELEEDPSLLLDLKEDVREECESLGRVTNVVLWDKEPEGIMTVKFAQHQSAQACVEKMDGRFFAGRQVIAHLLEGKPRFQRSNRVELDDDEDADREDRTRQDAFGDWLEGEKAAQQD